MIKITARDLNNLIQLYQELEMEQKRVLATIKANTERLIQNHQDEQQQFKTLIERIDAQKLADFESFFRVVEKNKELEDQYVQDILDLDKQLMQLTRHRFFESKLFLKNIAALIEVNVRRLVEDRNYGTSLNQNYLAYRQQLEERRRTVGIKDIYEGQKPDTFELYLEHTKKVDGPKKDAPKDAGQTELQTPTPPKNIGVEQQVIKPDLQRQKQIQDKTLRDFDRARDKARDSGF
ncbi:MAG: hypothetical protein K8I00_08925 [Candidatus Omnitrophica bacterium]|nr:hypothetical protein [Candidatus Omnitrophota bacterium]